MDANFQLVKVVCAFSFNPRARDGRENQKLSSHRHNKSFNPRARDGRELLLIDGVVASYRFNPRARDGREQHLMICRHTLCVSIHAPVMDAKASSLSR